MGLLFISLLFEVPFLRFSKLRFLFRFCNFFLCALLTLFFSIADRNSSLFRTFCSCFFRLFLKLEIFAIFSENCFAFSDYKGIVDTLPWIFAKLFFQEKVRFVPKDFLTIVLLMML